MQQIWWWCTWTADICRLRACMSLQCQLIYLQLDIVFWFAFVEILLELHSLSIDHSYAFFCYRSGKILWNSKNTHCLHAYGMYLYVYWQVKCFQTRETPWGMCSPCFSMVPFTLVTLRRAGPAHLLENVTIVTVHTGGTFEWHICVQPVRKLNSAVTSSGFCYVGEWWWVRQQL